MTLDFNGRPIIPKGTTVRVRTTNGGEKIATLAHDYRRTYDVVIDVGGQVIVIPSFRTTTVEELAA